MRVIKVAAAQMGPIQRSDGRQAAVRRMLALMDEAKAGGADLICLNPAGCVSDEQPCARASDCCSLGCVKGICGEPACAPAGGSCANDGDCCDGACMAGACAAAGAG